MSTREFPVTGLPSKTVAAQMLRVDKSTLGRNVDDAITAGRSHHLTATQILDLNEKFMRRRRDELMAELIAYTAAHDPGSQTRIEAEVQAWFERLEGHGSGNQVVSLDDTIASLRSGLGPDQQVVLDQLVAKAAAGERLTSSVGDAPAQY